MNTKKLLALWGLKWNPCSPELPSEALLVTLYLEVFQPKLAPRPVAKKKARV